jgi:phosphotransferase system enzyme I (PtsI)
LLRSRHLEPATDPFEALAAVADELSALADAVGEPAREILTAQAQIARDPAILSALRESETTDDPASRIVSAFAPFRAALAASSSPYLRERVTDVDEIAERALSRLRGQQAAERWPPVPGILIAAEITPADTARIPKDDLLGVVSVHGGALSHAAILARAIGIPAVAGVNADVAELEAGTWIDLDGDSGTVTVLDRSAPKSYKRAGSEGTDWLGQHPPATADGSRVTLQANIGSLEDIVTALEIGLHGSGLVRTEFLFTDSDPPSIETQLALYQEITASLPDGAVFRLLDCGADKPLRYVTVRSSPNPALGQRGVRALLANRELLETQLRALSAVSTDRPMHIMVPMVTSVGEMRDIRELAAPIFTTAGAQLCLGAMVEVPVAALSARELAAEADFLSIGTNDLIQYLCAVDRSTAELSHLVDPVPAAVWRVLRDVIAAGTAAGIPVGVCGELAGDPIGAGVLVALGASSLSISPLRAASVARSLSSRDLDGWRRHASQLLGEPSALIDSGAACSEDDGSSNPNGSASATLARGKGRPRVW